MNIALSTGGANIVLTSSGLAMYTVLTTQAQGRFSDNAFILFPGKTVINFIPFGPFGIFYKRDFSFCCVRAVRNWNIKILTYFKLHSEWNMYKCTNTNYCATHYAIKKKSVLLEGRFLGLRYFSSLFSQKIPQKSALKISKKLHTPKHSGVTHQSDHSFTISHYHHQDYYLRKAISFHSMYYILFFYQSIDTKSII